MKLYTIDFYNNDEFIVSYEILSSNINIAITLACQELYLYEYPTTYYVAYSEENNESKEGWI